MPKYTTTAIIALILTTVGLFLALINNQTPVDDTRPAVSTLGCWDEPNAEMPTGYERICGATGVAPLGSLNFGGYDTATWGTAH